MDQVPSENGDLMPKKKYRPSRDIPIAIMELRTFSPTKIREWILREFNASRTDTSISVWLGRHPDVEDRLRRDIQASEINVEEMTASVFDTGTFELFPRVRKWNLRMIREDIVGRKANISQLKRLCQGVKPGMSPVTQSVYRKGQRKMEGTDGIDLKEHGWVLKHPERLTVEDVNVFVDIMKEHYPKIDTAGERMAVRGFFLSNGISVGTQISGQKHMSAGKYARLKAPREVLQDIFDHLKRNNFEAYVVDMFMFKTGTRISATLAALLENMREIEGHTDIRIYDKGRRSKYPEGKPWDKFISPDLSEDIKALVDRRTTGKIFTYTDQEMADINMEMLKRFYPEIFEQFPEYNDSNHFWRHMFAQHMLAATNWNYGMVAALGGWDVKSLEESYGKPPAAVVKAWGIQKVADL